MKGFKKEKSIKPGRTSVFSLTIYPAQNKPERPIRVLQQTSFSHSPRVYFPFVIRLPVFQAETRAEFAERSVAKLEKTIDGLEGEAHDQYSSQISVICHIHSTTCPSCGQPADLAAPFQVLAWFSSQDPY